MNGEWSKVLFGGLESQSLKTNFLSTITIFLATLPLQRTCRAEYLKLLRYRTWAPWNPSSLQKSRCPKDPNPETLPAHQWNQTRADNHGLSFPNTLRWFSSQTWAKAAYLFIHIMKQTSWEKSGRRHKKSAFIWNWQFSHDNSMQWLQRN